jgi:acetoin utilization protein AcuB
MNVKDVMSTEPVVIRGDESCHDAATLMGRRRIRHLPVVDAAGQLEGMLTDRDLRHYLLSPVAVRDLGHLSVATLLKQARIRDVMSWPVFVTALDTDLVEAVRTMRERRVGALPVIEGRRVVGVVTETDLLRQIVAADTADDEVASVVVSYP